MSDEQRVRTMAGWIGVEISRSRVRTPGKAGYGLYRVRGSEGMCWHDAQQLPRSQRTEDLHGRRGAWTDYAFTLEEIEAEIGVAIGAGRPEGPTLLYLHRAGQPASDLVSVPTRWTSAYRGRRDLGVSDAVIDSDGRVPGRAELGMRSSVRSRQREHNAEFQAEHLERRRYGLERRYAEKGRRNDQRSDGPAR